MFARLFLKLRGIELLDYQQTFLYLQPFQLSMSPGEVVLLPGIENNAESTNKIFTRQAISTDPSYVWQYQNSSRKASHLRNGALCIDSKIVCPDYSQIGYYKGLKDWKKRPTRFTKTLIAPWSHYIDNLSFGGYYDYVVHIAAKLSRIKDSIPAEEFSQAIVSYPLFETSYEREFLKLLEINPAQVSDSRKVKYDFEKVILGNKGRPIFPHRDDIFSIKKNVERKLTIRQTDKSRVYISRSGRRNIKNECELISLLKRFDFTIIEDKPRSVAEQIEIYRNASFILGPHGASFTNIIWCEPGTHLFELFSPDYVTEFYLYFTQMLGMSYSAYCQSNLTQDLYFDKKSHVEQLRDKLERSMYVSIPDLEKSLTQLLGNRYMISTYSKIV